MVLVEGLTDLSGYPVWWVVTDSDLIPFQGPDAKFQAEQYMKVGS